MIDYRALEKLIDLDACPRLTEKYSGIAALALDLPRIEPDSWEDFWRIWEEEKSQVWRNHIDRGAQGQANPSLTHTQWDGVSIFELSELYEAGAWGSKISQPMIDANSRMLQNIFDLMPFVKFRSIRLWSAHKTIPPHYDGNMPATLDGKLRFPTEIRIMLDDKNLKETFWLTPSKQHQPHTVVGAEHRHYVKLPVESNTFAWNNEDYLHAADFNERYRKILLVIKGWVDVNRLEKLLDQSIERFPDHVIRVPIQP